jgi:sec-independent protein translocase protein TatA
MALYGLWCHLNKIKAFENTKANADGSCKMNIGVWQIVIIAVVVVLLFGRGKISELMGDVAKGITSFKKGLNEKEDEGDTIEAKASEVANKVKDETKAG